MSSRTPVITGTGIICAAGCGLAEVWTRLRAAQTGLGPLTLFPSPRYAAYLVGQVRAEVDRLAGGVRGSRTDKLAWIAAGQAVEEAGGGPGSGSVPAERAGVLVGSTVGGMLGSEEFLGHWLKEKRRRFGPLRFHECAGAADLCARGFGTGGPCATVSTACSAGAMALAAAAELIVSGEADWMLAGGVDSLCRLTLNGFGSLLLLDPAGCRPFDARRAGISLGEGGAMLVLEAEETARARGAQVLARLAGWGASCDAWHATAPHPEGRGALAAMQKALRRARLEPAQIDFVSAHGTGTPDNDAMEAGALTRLFGGSPPPTASWMRFFGHTLAASGAIKAVLAVRCFEEQALPPSLGLSEPDPKLGLNLVPEFRSAPVSRILSNSFGFGGNNVALVFERSESTEPKRQDEVRECRRQEAPKIQRRESALAVLGAGVVCAAGTSIAELAAALKAGRGPVSDLEVPCAAAGARVPVYACGEFSADGLIDPVKRRRLSRFQQMAIVAARRSLPPELARSVPPDRVCVALGTGLGSLNDTAAFVENLVLKEERAPRPLWFANSVHNSLAGQVALELNLSGLNTTPVQHEISFETALWQAAAELREGGADLALAGAADELNAYHVAAGARWGWWQPEGLGFGRFSGKGRVWPGEGCALVTLARAGVETEAMAWVLGIRIGRVRWSMDGRLDAAAEALWIEETLAREGQSLDDIDLLLTGADGEPRLERAYAEVAAAIGRRRSQPVSVGAYKRCCGEFHAASAIGFLTAVGLVRGEIPPAACAWPAAQPPPAERPCRKVVLYTLSRSGVKGMCCVRR